ncbi:hypothetical protein [Variovorax sp. LT1R16]|uniref:hypothetical protein n=1 Tax=Variovorax sp. LT1R16 TaxID=3443728 RepID=UPI003F458B5E
MLLIVSMAVDATDEYEVVPFSRMTFIRGVACSVLAMAGYVVEFGLAGQQDVLSRRKRSSTQSFVDGFIARRQCRWNAANLGR